MWGKICCLLVPPDLSMIICMFWSQFIPNWKYLNYPMSLCHPYPMSTCSAAAVPLECSTCCHSRRKHIDTGMNKVSHCTSIWDTSFPSLKGSTINHLGGGLFQNWKKKIKKKNYRRKSEKKPRTEEVRKKFWSRKSGWGHPPARWLMVDPFHTLLKHYNKSTTVPRAMHIVVCQRGGVSNKPTLGSGQRQDT